jgi:transposase
MDGQLTQVCCPEYSSSEWVTILEDLRQDVAALRNRVDHLERENLQLRQQAGYWQSRHRDALRRIGELEQQVEHLQGEKRQLQADLFGRRSETTLLKDRSNHLDDPQDDTPEPGRKRGQQAGNPGPKRRDYSSLPVREVFVELPHEQRVCPHCGQPLRLRSDTEDSEQIEIDVRAHRRVIHRRRYERTCACQGNRTLTAPPLPKLIPKGLYGTSMWVEILLDKYSSYRPTERFLASWRLGDLDLAAGTVTDGLKRLEILLRPIYEAIKKRNPDGDLHLADETRWRVFVVQEGKQGYGWWLWVLSGPDTVVYVLDASRSHAVPEGHYRAQSRGVLVVDRYSAYKAMIWVKDGVIVLAFCWSHVRRDFIRVGKGWPELKTWALGWLRRIRVLYQLNHRRLETENGSAAFGDTDGCLRQAVAEIKMQMETELARADPATPCRKVLESLAAHWEGLTLFVDDPRIPMDNNTSERRARGPAVARKNFYGSGSLWSGQLAATAFSIFATLALWELNPRKWLTWYFQRCAAAGGKVPGDVEQFLPWYLSQEKKKELGVCGPTEGQDTS